jgi:hypothetical protein
MGSPTLTLTGGIGVDEDFAYRTVAILVEPTWTLVCSYARLIIDSLEAEIGPTFDVHHVHWFVGMPL